MSVTCDTGDACPEGEWFHWEAVGIRDEPSESSKWFCSICLNINSNRQSVTTSIRGARGGTGGAGRARGGTGAGRARGDRGRAQGGRG